MPLTDLLVQPVRPDLPVLLALPDQPDLRVPQADLRALPDQLVPLALPVPRAHRVLPDLLAQRDLPDLQVLPAPRV